MGCAKSSRAVGDLDDPAEIHHADAARHVADHGEVVADEQVGQAEPVLQVAHQVQDLRLHRDVERGGRLVADDELAFGRQRAGDGDALALSAGELVRILLAVRRMQADQRQQLADAVARFLLAVDQAEGADRLGDDVGPPASAD